MKMEENEVKRPKALISTISKKRSWSKWFLIIDPEDGDEIDDKSLPAGERGG